MNVPAVILVVYAAGVLWWFGFGVGASTAESIADFNRDVDLFDNLIVGLLWPAIVFLSLFA